LRIRLSRRISVPNVPVGNYLVMLLMAVTFALQFTYDGSQRYLGGLVLDSWSFKAIFSYMWLHASVAHAAWNLAALWIFGRYVCLRIGNVNYPFAYLFVGIVSAVVHVIYDGRPAIGASGAVMGILGMYVVLCFERFGWLGPWLILVWFLLSLTEGAAGYLPVAFLAHIGGFLGGVALAGVLLLFKVVERENILLGAPA
jgi:membrane associated rhomboid family serine protease